MLCLLPFILLVVAYSPLPAYAHTPGPMTLSYDADTNELTVTVTHAVSTPSHYIASIEVWKNDISQELRTYASQESSSGMDDTFSIDATGGDVLKAIAICSISGSVTAQITVSIDTTPTGTATTTTSMSTAVPPPNGSSFIPIAGIVAIVIVILFVLFIFRRVR